MGKTVAELNETMTIDELREWQAFDSVDPIGGHRGDVQAAMIALASCGSKDAKLSDFILFDRVPMTAEQRAIFKARQDAARSEAYTQSLIGSLKSRVKAK